MKYLAVLGRQPELSLAELTALFGDSVRQISPELAVFETTNVPDINRLGGTLKLARLLSEPPIDYLKSLPEGKITLGFSDYSRSASAKTVRLKAMKLKKILKRHSRSVRVLDNKTAVLSTATSHHNQLGEKPNHLEFIFVGKENYLVIGVQNITAYAHRDQARPARDAKVGMLPPKLAQILINLCAPLPAGSRLLDPFCGTGVLLQEAALMGYLPYGTDLSPRMVDYTHHNLDWLVSTFSASQAAVLAPVVTGLGGYRSVVTCAMPSKQKNVNTNPVFRDYAQLASEHKRRAPVKTGGANAVSKNAVRVDIGNAMDFTWQQPIDAVACETYLGPPMSTLPSDIKLKKAKHECREIILGFLKNLAPQIKSGTPVVLAIPAWLRLDGSYSTLNILDEIKDMGYNVTKYNNSSKEPLLYHREGQVVAREIIVLRKR